jgi:hypothetical protein
VARKEKADLAFGARLDAFEQALFLLKVEYDKYFNGIEKIEPLKDRDDLRRELREILTEKPGNTAQLHKLRTLRARFATHELYWQRQVVQIERGTHPKSKFRADIKDKARAEAEARAAAAGPDAKPAAAPRPAPVDAEDAAFRAVFNKYVELRGQCGQSTDLDYGALKNVLQQQVRTIKSRYNCNAVKFKVTIEEGKARVKAVPLR